MYAFLIQEHSEFMNLNFKKMITFTILRIVVNERVKLNKLTEQKIFYKL